MSEKRYVVLPGPTLLFYSKVSGAREEAQRTGGLVYELGKKVRELDATKLAEWVKPRNRASSGPYHDAGCGFYIARLSFECGCGLQEAFEAAGID